MGSLKPSREQTELSKLSEFDVLLLYMRDVGFEDMGLEQLEMVCCNTALFYFSSGPDSC